MSPAPRGKGSAGRSNRGGNSLGGRGRPPVRGGAPRARSGAAPARRQAPRTQGLGGDQVEGRNAVIELLAAKTRPTSRVLMAAELDPSEQLDRIEGLCRSLRVPLEVVSRARIDREAATESHQGVIAFTKPLKDHELDDLLNLEGGHPFLLVCDGLTDPHNLGSLLRTAECAGVTGILLPRHRSARVSPTVTKVAAGAIEHLNFCSVAGIPSVLEQLAKAGVEVVGLAGEAKRSLFSLDLRDRPVALVVGSEDRGLASLSRKRCTELASIPQAGNTESLNASVAGGIAIYEVARQRGFAG